MDPTSREDLSALMDGELAPEPTRFLLRRLDHNPELGAAWSRWHLIRACLQSDSARMSEQDADSDFAARVVASLEADGAPRQRGRHWTRYIGGGALAAGVAVAALVLNVPSSPVGTLAPVAQENPVVTSGPSASALATAVPDVLATPPWLLSRQPTVLSAEPASADVVYGTGLLQPNYLRQHADSAHDAVLPYAPYRIRRSGQPFSIEWVPVRTPPEPPGSPH